MTRVIEVVYDGKRKSMAIRQPFDSRARRSRNHADNGGIDFVVGLAPQVLGKSGGAVITIASSHGLTGLAGTHDDDGSRHFKIVIVRWRDAQTLLRWALLPKLRLPIKQTCIAVGIEPITRFDGMLVSAPHHLKPAERADQHEER